MRKKLSYLILFVLLVSLSVPANAEPLEVPNFSFEYGHANPDEPNDTDPNTWVQLLGHVLIDEDEGMAAWQEGEGSKGWIGVDVDCNVEEPAPIDEECKTWFTATDGYAICFMQHTGSIMYQVLDHNIVEGGLYTLKWDGMGWANDMVASLFYLEYDEESEVNVPVYIASDVFYLDPKDPEVWNGWLADLTTCGVVLPGSAAIGKQLGIEYNAIGDSGYGFIDNVRLDYVLAKSAYFPNPADGAINVGLDTPSLLWEPGLWAQTVDGHDVYFGTSFEDVNNATPGNPLDVYKGRFDANSWPLDITLEIAETYYWRVDEVNDSHPDELWRGSVWSFKANDGTACFPSPFDGEQDVDPEVVLSWSPGIAVANVAGHDVYFGTDFDEVNEADHDDLDIFKGRQDDCSYDAGTEEDPQLAADYYWRIDEINDANLWKGHTWRFTVAEYLAIDDMESYKLSGLYEITNTWKSDWYTSTAEIYLQTTKSDANYVHDGDNSMRYYYGNFAPPYVALAEIPFDSAQDWTVAGIKALTLYFRADMTNLPDAVQPMYVQISDGTNTGTVQYEDPNDLIRGLVGWQEWNIDLQDFVSDAPSLNLAAITKLGIKIGDGNEADAGYNVYFDDIRLYPTRCVPAYAHGAGSFRYIDRYSATGNLIPDCEIDYYDLFSLAGDWLVSEIGTVTTDSEPNDTNLIGHWTMNDNAATSVVLDSSVNGNHGVLYDDVDKDDEPVEGETQNYSITGVIDGALEFEVANEYVVIPALNLNTNTLTVSAWVLPYKIQELYTSIVSCNEVNSLNFCFGSNSEYIEPAWFGNNELCYYWTGWSWDFHSELIVPDGLWSFVGLTIEPDKGTLYLYDGLSMSVSRNYESHVPRPFEEISYFGASYDHKGEKMGGFFEGAIDDVYIYDRVLSPAEMLYVALQEPGSQYIPLEPWRANADGDDVVDLQDYAIMADNWLTEVLWP